VRAVGAHDLRGERAAAELGLEAEEHCAVRQREGVDRLDVARRTVLVGLLDGELEQQAAQAAAGRDALQRNRRFTPICEDLALLNA